MSERFPPLYELILSSRQAYCELSLKEETVADNKKLTNAEKNNFIVGGEVAHDMLLWAPVYERLIVCRRVEIIVEIATFEIMYISRL